MEEGVIMAADFDASIRSAHRANIDRYRRLLRSQLTDHERQFIARRLAEEEAALRGVIDNGPPLDLVMD